MDVVPVPPQGTVAQQQVVDLSADGPEPPAKKARSTSGRPSRATPFQKGHCDEFGLVVLSRDVTSKQINAVRCRFCISFGRENKTTTIKSFQGPPFRPSNFKNHLEREHPERWELYQKATMEAKATFFDVDVKFAETIYSHFGSKSDDIHFKIEKQIVDTVIGKMLWNSEEGSATFTRAMSIFKLDASETCYEVRFAQVQQYRLAVRLVGHGLSFKATSSAIQEAKEILEVAKLGFCSQENVASYVRATCASALQNLSMMLRTSWTFAIALDGSVNQGTSYIDVRVRFPLSGCIKDYHVIAVPFSGSHTGLAMFEMLEQLFDVLCPNWQKKIIGCSTDGAANMTGTISGVVSRLANVSGDGFIRVWCLLHQADLVLQAAYRNLENGAYLKSLTGLIAHLRRQKTLIGQMKATCPALSSTRWISMTRVSTFLSEHRGVILTHFDQLDPVRSNICPAPAFWMTLAVISQISSLVHVTVQKLQGKRTVLNQQSHVITELIESLKRMAFAEGPFEVEQLSALDPEEYFLNESHAVMKEDVKGMVQDFGGVFALQSLRNMEPHETEIMLKTIAEMYLHIIQGLSKIVAVRDSRNNAAVEMFYPVMPHELIKVRPRQLAELVLEHHTRVLTSYCPDDIDRIVSQHKDFLEAYHREPRLKLAIDRCSTDSSFEDCWAIRGLKGQFPLLCDFCGGISSVFPNTASVEADFSDIKWESDEFRTALTSFSLEGILHCKQFVNLSI
jgi:hypothetical protein